MSPWRQIRGSTTVDHTEENGLIKESWLKKLKQVGKVGGGPSSKDSTILSLLVSKSQPPLLSGLDFNDPEE